MNLLLFEVNIPRMTKKQMILFVPCEKRGQLGTEAENYHNTPFNFLNFEACKSAIHIKE